MSNLLTVALFKEPQEQISHSCPLKWANEQREKRKSAKSQRANSQPCQKPMRGTPLKVTIFKKNKGKNTTKMEYLNTLEQIGSKKNICDIFSFFLKGVL